MPNDRASERVAWVAWAFALVIVAGLLAYACASCTPRVIPVIKAPPPAYGHRVVGT